MSRLGATGRWASGSSCAACCSGSRSRWSSGSWSWCCPASRMCQLPRRAGCHGAIALLNALLWPIVIRVAAAADRAHLRPRLAGAERGGGRCSRSSSSTATRPDFLDAVAAAFLLSIALMVLAPALSFDDDARQLRIVRRRARACARGEPHRRPGRDPVRDRRPRRAGPAAGARARDTRRRWRAGSRTAPTAMVPWECDLSSQTGASQAGLLLGSNYDMPAFRWYEKESGQTMVSNHGKDAVEIERAPLRRRRPAGRRTAPAAATCSPATRRAARRR